MSLGAKNAKATGGEDDLAISCTGALRLSERLCVGCCIDLGRIQAAHTQRFRGEPSRIAAEHDVGTATGHVGGDRHCTAASRLCNNGRLALVLLRIQDVMGNPFAIQECGEMLGALNRCGANQHWLPSGTSLLDVLHDGGIFRPLSAIDKIRLIVAHHRSMGWNCGDFKVVDLAELFRLGHGCTGHTSELAVKTEVVLEGDRCKRYRLALNVEPLFRLDCLMKAFRPTTPWHLAAGELVNDHNLAALNDVVAIALKECMRTECRLKVPCHEGIAAVQVLNAEHLLNASDTILCWRNRLLLLVEEVVAARLCASITRAQARNEL